MIRGETVILLEQAPMGTDPFGKPIYEDIEVAVENVIIGSPGTDDVTADLNILGKKLVFVLGIPKGDTHDWKDKIIIIRGDKFRTYGFPLTQTEANIPGRWNTQVKVEKYE